MNKALKRTILSGLCIILALVTVFGIYTSDFYRADRYALSALDSTRVVTVYEEDNTMVFCPQSAEIGFIFYPGGKVEYTAYAPLMRLLAENNVHCIITEMPFNLAVLDINAADGIAERYSNIKKWYIAGHSLGGSMASTYFSQNADIFEGLVLLASYSTADISEFETDVLSITAENDGVLNIEKYKENFINLPTETTEEITIPGGCHAYFGSYGLQAGDGQPQITVQQQTEQTAQAILEMIK